jgi:hypothetical protein
MPADRELRQGEERDVVGQRARQRSRREQRQAPLGQAPHRQPAAGGRRPAATMTTAPAAPERVRSCPAAAIETSKSRATAAGIGGKVRNPA